MPRTPDERAATRYSIDESNLDAAVKDLELNGKEKYLYRKHLKNLNGPGGVQHPATIEEPPSVSTLYQTTIEKDGKFYNIPTIWDGSARSVDESVTRAEKEGLKRFPSYKSAKEAEDRYMEMHPYMDKDAQSFLQNQGTQP